MWEGGGAAAVRGCHARELVDVTWQPLPSIHAALRSCKGVVASQGLCPRMHQRVDDTGCTGEDGDPSRLPAGRPRASGLRESGSHTDLSLNGVAHAQFLLQSRYRRPVACGRRMSWLSHPRRARPGLAWPGTDVAALPLPLPARLHARRATSIAFSYQAMSVVLFGLGYWQAVRGGAIDYRADSAAAHEAAWAAKQREVEMVEPGDSPVRVSPLRRQQEAEAEAVAVEEGMPLSDATGVRLEPKRP